VLTTKVSEVSSQVVPSGGDFATTAAPIEADAPGRFSTMMVAPSRCCRLGCRSRAIASEVPPAANGLMMRMIFDAAGCARAATGANSPAATSERLLSTCVSIPVSAVFWARVGQ
jgi:hypothetical protein